MLYVIAKDLAHNTITVSPNRYPTDKKKTEIILRDINWIGKIEKGSCDARFRYRQGFIPARIYPDENRAVLEEPHYVPEGQSLVVYREKRCLGGGVVDKSFLISQ